MSGVINVISYSLFLNDNIGNIKFLKYLYGLLCNIIKIKKFLPSWEIWVHVDENIFLFKKYNFCVKLLHHCKILNKNVKLIRIHNSYKSKNEYKFNCLIARFNPINDLHVNFLAVRDTDSIIGALDIFFIKMFSMLHGRIFCCYKEKNMKLQTMGGGFSCNVKLFREKYPQFNIHSKNYWKIVKNCGLMDSDNRDAWYRDEIVLDQILKISKREEKLIIPTRMKECGGYYLYYGEDSKIYHRLWTEIDDIFYTLSNAKETNKSYDFIESTINKMLFSLITSKINPEIFILISIVINRGNEKNGYIIYCR